MSQKIVSAIGAGLVLLGTSAARAVPMLDFSEEDAGDGLTRFTAFVDADDGLLRSIFLDLSFTGPFNEIPFEETTDVVDDDPVWLTDPEYAARQGQDTFFFVEDRFDTGLVGQFFDITHTADAYDILAGSGAGSELLRFPLAQLVVPTRGAPGDAIRYSGTISRGGLNYDVEGTIPLPEPGTLPLLALALASARRLLRRPS